MSRIAKYNFKFQTPKGTFISYLKGQPVHDEYVDDSWVISHTYEFVMPSLPQSDLDELQSLQKDVSKETNEVVTQVSLEPTVIEYVEPKVETPTPQLRPNPRRG